MESSWGLHIKEWEWYELSVVTVPANPDAMITSVKQIKDAFNVKNLPPLDAPAPIINPISPNLTPKPTPNPTTDTAPNSGSVALTTNNGVSLV